MSTIALANQRFKKVEASLSEKQLPANDGGGSVLCYHLAPSTRKHRGLSIERLTTILNKFLQKMNPRAVQPAELLATDVPESKPSFCRKYAETRSMISARFV